MVQLVHQRQQAPQLARREALAREPGQVRARQVGDQPPLVFAERHDARHQQLQQFGIHAPYLAGAAPKAMSAAGTAAIFTPKLEMDESVALWCARICAPAACGLSWVVWASAASVTG